LADAEPLFRRTLAIWEAASDQQERHIATALNNLAGIYRISGRYADAELLYRRALAILEKAAGPDDVNLALVLCNLRVLDQSEGKYDAARQLETRAGWPSSSARWGRITRT